LYNPLIDLYYRYVCVSGGCVLQDCKRVHLKKTSTDILYNNLCMSIHEDDFRIMMLCFYNFTTSLLYHLNFTLDKRNNFHTRQKRITYNLL
jgi:hypothetical protein